MPGSAPQQLPTIPVVLIAYLAFQEALPAFKPVTFGQNHRAAQQQGLTFGIDPGMTPQSADIGDPLQRAQVLPRRAGAR